MTIYLYGTNDESTIKIGKTTRSVTARRRHHEGRGPARQELHFLAGMLGADSDETSIHRCFRRFLLPNEREWFSASEPLVGWVRWLRRQWFVAETEDQCASLRRVSSEHWLPGEGRTLPPLQCLSFNPWGFLEGEVTGDDFYTDARIIECARAVMGGIDLDPASHPAANRVVRAAMFFTLVDNGLVQQWHGRVWCNPPFAKWDLWVPKLLEEWQSGRIEEMCVLIATRSLTTRCVAPALESSAAICILTGRIPFWGPKATNSPDDGHAILYYGTHPSSFASHFSNLGQVYEKERTPR